MSSKKNKGLGKGLSALFGEQKSVEKSTKIEANSQNALIGDLARNKYQPRTIFDDEKLDELASSIKKMELFSLLRLEKKLMAMNPTKSLPVKDDGWLHKRPVCMKFQSQF